MAYVGWEASHKTGHAKGEVGIRVANLKGFSKLSKTRLDQITSELV